MILFGILLSGCQSGPSAMDEAATMVAETVAARPPTATPVPTSTALSISKSKPLPTAAPIIALTTTVEAASILSELDVNVGSNSDIPYRDGYLAWQEIETIEMNMSGPQKDSGIHQVIADEYTPANFIFKSTVRWHSSGALICGLTFRSEPDIEQGKQYQFYFYRLSGLPAYEIDIFEFGRFKNTISDVKFSEGISYNKNEFVLIVQNEEFTVVINGKQQGKFYDWSNQRKDGHLAFLAWQDSGKGHCSFEDSWLWVLP